MSDSAFLRAREVLLRHRNDHSAAHREFAWPLLDRFNWALDYFDVIARDTSDVASRDGDGYYWYIGRIDDVFKSSDYRISPFELESALIEHEAVAEAAVVPSPDALRLAVPKAFIVLKAGYPPAVETARSIFAFCRERLAPYMRIRRIEFCELPKTIFGKIRRVQLRGAEHRAGRARAPAEFWEDDV